MRFMSRALLRGLLLTCLVASTAHAAPRETIDLDGVWNFATDPDGRGETDKWFAPATALPAMPLPGYAPEANGTIRVPGIWDNQGYGTETDKVRHNFVGKGWYKRQVDIPQSWAGRRAFLLITGASRSAKAWVNGHYLGEHIGFLSAFEWDVTEHIAPGQPATFVIQVDSAQRWEVDALYGACSFTDYMDVAWGGIWGHVSLEARADVWLSDLYVQPNVAESACTAAAALNGAIAACDAVKLEVFDAKRQCVAESVTTVKVEPALPEPMVNVTGTIPNAALWTPDTPALYTARLTLLKGSEALDAVETRFGMRQFSIDGHNILLNGTRIMLRGYGDDHIYPEQMAMPSDKEVHIKRLRLIKSYGFNHVRHHSTMMPPEYYDACDEAGILCSAEFPIVYSRYLPGSGSHWLSQVKPCTDPAPANETYLREWSAAIKRFRNHPSIFTWVMGNELYGGVPLRLDFQREKNRLDPSRFFCDSDGVWGFDVSPDLARLVPPGDAVNVLNPNNDRDTLDLYFLQVVDPLTYAVIYPETPPKKPVVVHEMGNFLTFARPDIIDRFQHNIKPFWLTEGAEKLKTLGRRKEAMHWAAASERLYAFLHKRNVETVRKNPLLSGYHWWLFQDYWTTSNGLVDAYFRPKSIPPAEVLKFNNDVVLLQDGLARTYRGHGKLEVKPIVSNYSNSVLDAGACWEIRLGNELLLRKTIPCRIPQGQVSSAEVIAVELPDVTQPTQLKVSAELSTEGRRYVNDWSSWLYPAAIALPKSSVPVFVADSCRDVFGGMETTPFPAEGILSEHAVYVTETLSEPRLTDAMARGATVVLLGPEPRLGPSYAVTFGTTWWKAGDSPERNHTGTFVYDHPVTRRIAPDAYCDVAWFDLLEGGMKYILEDVPSYPSIIIRALPSMVLMQESALLFEVGVGKGCLIASGLNHRRAPGSPENQWILAKMLAHAATFPNPKETWPVSFLSNGPKAPLVKLPANLGPTAENTPVVFGGRPLLVLNHHDDKLTDIEQRVKAMYLFIRDPANGQEIARFGEGHTYVSAFAAEPVLHVFASEEREKNIFHFASTDLKTWERELAIPVENGEHLYNSSVCVDNQGYLMAYESDKPVQFCIKFARSKDLKTWQKIDGITFAGVDSKQYSACPTLRYFKPYYYVIYLHEAIPGHNGWVSFLARSKDLATWQLSPMNPILEAGPGEGCNNSDVDLFELEDKTYLFYANGDQQTWYSLRMASYDGSVKQFFEACFPKGAPMTEVSAVNSAKGK